MGHQMGELRVYIWWVAGELLKKLLTKISALIFAIYIDRCCQQVRKCAAKIQAHHYSLLVPLYCTISLNFIG